MEQLPQELQLQFVDPDTGEENPNFIYTDVPEMNDTEEEEINVVEHLTVEKEDIDINSIFDKAMNDVGGLDTIETEIPEGVPEISLVKSPKKIPEISQVKSNIKPVKLNKNGQPRKKRVYTDAQREAMRERMKKAREQSGKNKVKKQEEKAQEKKYKELMKQKKLLEMDEIEEKIKKKKEPKKEPAPEPAPAISIEAPAPKGLSRDELKQAQFDAILQYETLRKQRKAKKKQEEQIQQYKKDVENSLKKELGWRDVAGEYADCF
tara:strand:- start:308 stop:1099 length:792 start_codon:yes stop_codon:yes gene_type:complete